MDEWVEQTDGREDEEQGSGGRAEGTCVVEPGMLLHSSRRVARHNGWVGSRGAFQTRNRASQNSASQNSQNQPTTRRRPAQCTP